MQEKITRIKSKVGVTSVGVIPTKPRVRSSMVIRLIEEDYRLQAKHLGINY